MVWALNWDICLAIGSFFVQCALALLGLQLAHWKHKAGFIGLVVVGAIFTGWAVERGIESSNKLQSQLTQIQQNTMPTKPIPHFHIQRYLPHKPVVGQPVKTNIYYENSGGVDGSVVIIDQTVVWQSVSQNIQEKLQAEGNFFSILKGNMGTVSAHAVSTVSHGQNWITLNGPVLSAVQAKGLLRGKMTVYVMGVFRYVGVEHSDLEFCASWNSDWRVVVMCNDHNHE